jgi:hypothetical protein
MCTSLFFKPRMVTRPLQVRCFSDISQESYQRNCSLYRVAGCGRTKGAAKLDGAQVGLEGVVSKRPGSRHLYGRTCEWLKMKNPGSTSGGSARTGVER